MQISTSNSQTRRVDKFTGVNAKQQLLNEMTKQITSINTDCTQTFKHGDNWAKRQSNTTFEVDDFLNRNQEIALRLEQGLRETVAVYMQLFMYDGVMNADTYNKIIDTISANYEKAKKAFSQQAHILVLYQNEQFIGTKLFDDEVKLQLWCNKHLGIDYHLLLSPSTVPPELKGTILTVQDWCTNPNEFFELIKSQS